MRRFAHFLCAGLLILTACSARAPGPESRTAPALLSWISDLPIPDGATTVNFTDTFVEPNGKQHQQGAVEGTVKVDSTTFQTLWHKADSLGYEPIASYTGPYRIAIMTNATGGRFQIKGEMRGNYMLTVLNPIDHTVSVQYAQITGVPWR